MVPTLFFLPGSNEKVVLIAVAGRSNGLGPVLSGNTTLPVINCPPVKPENVAQDIWSSLNVPSGELYYCTILRQEVRLSTTSTPISIVEAFSLRLCQDINHTDWWLSWVYFQGYARKIF